MRLGMQAYDTAQQSKRQKVLDDRETKRWEREQREFADQDEAKAGLKELVTKGKRDDAAIAANRTANQAGLDSAVDAIGQGMKVVEPEYPALQREYTPATDYDMNLGLQRAALAKGDYGAVGGLQKEAGVLKGYEADRTFLQQARSLYDNREKDPATWAKFAQPHTGMVSNFQGLDFDARVNPKTGAIEIIPYTGGGVTEASFEQAIPYMLAADRLSRQYGDPGAAIDALAKMSDAERARIMDMSRFKMDKAKTIGGSIMEERKITDNAAHNKGMLGVAQMNAQTNREYKDGMLALGEQKASGTGAKSSRPQVDIKKNDDGSYLAVNKENGDPVYNMDANGRKLPLGMSVEQFTKLQAESEKAGVRMVEGFGEDGRFMYGYQGADGEIYSDPASAAAAGKNITGKKPEGKLPARIENQTKAPAPAPSRTAGTRNALLDKNGRILPNAKQLATGGSLLSESVIPALGRTAEAVVDVAKSAGTGPRALSLSTKIARGEKLDPAETVWAKRYGLIN